MEEPRADLAEGASYHGAFGTVSCRRCGLSWLEECVPEFCPECHARVAWTPGRGFEDLIDLMKLGGVRWKLRRCGQCGMRIPKQIASTRCLRCHSQL